VSLADGRLADVAPTLLALMGLKQPPEMTGHSLLRGTPREHVLAVPAAMRREAARKVA
jgi:2,3-bisphosphoglycerate-independent phosphoglycerate mutase